MTEEMEKRRADLEGQIHSFEKARDFMWFSWLSIGIGAIILAIVIVVKGMPSILLICAILLIVVGFLMGAIGEYGKTKLPSLKRQLDAICLEAITPASNRVQNDIVNQSDEKRYCRFCGQHIATDVQYCGKCGKKQMDE